MRLSWMTYGVLKHLSRADLLRVLSDNGFEGVEFRTDAKHGHGVEPTLSQAERKQVVQECEAANVRIMSIATGNRYHDTDAAEVKKHIEQTRERIDLAHDLGAPRVRVFGNNFPEGVPREKTITQVAQALTELAEYGDDKGVRVDMEIHGEFNWRESRSVAEQVEHENFGLIWNSIPGDVVNASVQTALEAVWPWIDHVHMHDLVGRNYPYRELFRLLVDKGYSGYMSAEVERGADQGVGDEASFAGYYAELCRAYIDLARVS